MRFAPPSGIKINRVVFAETRGTLSQSPATKVAGMEEGNGIHV